MMEDTQASSICSHCTRKIWFRVFQFIEGEWFMASSRAGKRCGVRILCWELEVEGFFTSRVHPFGVCVPRAWKGGLKVRVWGSRDLGMIDYRLNRVVKVNGWGGNVGGATRTRFPTIVESVAVMTPESKRLMRKHDDNKFTIIIPDSWRLVADQLRIVKWRGSSARPRVWYLKLCMHVFGETQKAGHGDRKPDKRTRNWV